MQSHQAFIYDWSLDDSDSTLINIYCVDTKNKTMCIHIRDFNPYVFVILDPTIKWNFNKMKQLVHYIEQRLKATCADRLFHKKKQILHGDPGKTVQCLQLFFTSTPPLNKLFYMSKNKHCISGVGSSVALQVVEHKLCPILKLVSSNELPSCGWISFESFGVDVEKTTRCESEFTVSHKRIVSQNNCNDLANPLVMAFDIEVYSSVAGTFPNPQRPGDEIFQISCIFWNVGKKNYSSYLLSLFNPKVHDNSFTCRSFSSESDLLEGFIFLFKEYKPTIVTGYNIISFDMNYIIDRCSYTKLKPSLLKMGMDLRKQSSIVDHTWESSAYGSQTFKYLHLDGTIYIDMFSFVRREFRLDNYKLDTVASHFLNATKDPLTHKDIFRGYELGRDGDRRAIGIVGEYCVKDSMLTVQLFEHLDMWLVQTEMAKVCHVPIGYLLIRGQGVKVLHQLYYYCHNNHILVNESAKKITTEDVKGATVLKPVLGIHDNVVSFDFKSLYPSVIIANNIDYTTLLPTDSEIPDSHCNIIVWDEHQNCKHTMEYDESGKNVICESFKHRFLKKPIGVLPSIEIFLLEAREQMKQKMKLLNKDDPRYKLFDKRQLAYKISANSVYGILNSEFAKFLFCKQAAESVTAAGRHLLRKTSKELHEKFGAFIIYGDTDSCYVNFPTIPLQNLSNYAKWVEKEINSKDFYPSPVYLEYENKICRQFLIVTPKQYMYREGLIKPCLITPEVIHGCKHLDNKCSACEQSFRIEKKGGGLTNRTTSLFFKALYEKVIGLSFDNISLGNLERIIHEEFIQCCSHSFQKKMFITTKNIKNIGEYKVKKCSKKCIAELQSLNLTTEQYLSCANLTSIGKTVSEIAVTMNVDIPCVETLVRMFLETLPGHIFFIHHTLNKRGIFVGNGDRLEQIYVEHDNERVCYKLEDPVYQAKFSHIIRIDFIYYIELACNSLDNLAEIIFKNKKKPFSAIRNLHSTKKRINRELLSVFEPTFTILDA